jgi:hypothetical protein
MESGEVKERSKHTLTLYKGGTLTHQHPTIGGTWGKGCGMQQFISRTRRYKREERGE